MKRHDTLGKYILDVKIEGKKQKVQKIVNYCMKIGTLASPCIWFVERAGPTVIEQLGRSNPWAGEGMCDF